MNNIVDFNSFKEALLSKNNPFLDNILRAIRALRKETLEEGEAFNDESQKRLAYLCAKLDIGFKLPHLSVVYDGSITVNWQKQESDAKMTMLSLIFAPKNIVFAMRENGVALANGGLNFSYQSLDIYASFFNLFLEKHFKEENAANVQNVRR